MIYDNLAESARQLIFIFDFFRAESLGKQLAAVCFLIIFFEEAGERKEISMMEYVASYRKYTKR
jgi:hypothetical protein